MPRLFARLRPPSTLSNPAYDAAVNVARSRHWYQLGGVPDTMDGRFAVLSTVLALLTLRIEEGGRGVDLVAVALTEAFIADMHAQMQQAGFGDPSLGKQVRHLVGSLASRVDRWRRVLASSEDWTSAVATSLYRDAPIPPDVLDHATAELRALHDRLACSDLRTIEAGDWS